jgi:EpsI family protein
MIAKPGKVLITGVVLASLMSASMLLANALKPTKKLVDLQPREKLATLVPLQLGDWRGIAAESVVLPVPEMRENLKRIYTDTLIRTYVDSQGRPIMLSIAYGDDQRDGMNMHYPEVCYPAQGFQALSKRTDLLLTPFGTIQVKRLEMVLGQRHELVTYWTVIGERQSIGKIDKKLDEMSYGLRGLIPDGLLFRVSSIDTNAEAAYELQDEFVNTLLNVVGADNRRRLAGL